MTSWCSGPDSRFHQQVRRGATSPVLHSGKEVPGVAAGRSRWQGGWSPRAFSGGRYDGRPVRDWLADVVDRVVTTIDPLEVIVFGSIARGDEGPDSDIDLLVVLDHVEPSDKAAVLTSIYRGLRCGVPVDVIVTDLAEMTSHRGHGVGSVPGPRPLCCPTFCVAFRSALSIEGEILPTMRPCALDLSESETWVARWPRTCYGPVIS